jgi:uncharacterized protein involved in exopolysaccharide biosynthesis
MAETERTFPNDPWAGWTLDRRSLATILVSAALVAVAFGGVSLIMPREYSASVVLLPAKAERPSALGALGGQVGGLASLAGIELGKDDDKSEALATLRSRALAIEFIEARALMPVIFASQWDEAGDHWREGFLRKAPTIGDAYRKFDRKIRVVNEDRRTGVVTLTVRWRDPREAAEWANDLAARVNRKMRDRAIAEAEGSLEYLNRELAKTQVVELQQPIYRLVENRLNTVMMANAREEYAFRIIDPALAPDDDDYSSPLHWLYALAGAVLGALSGAVFVVSRRARIASAR